MRLTAFIYSLTHAALPLTVTALLVLTSAGVVIAQDSLDALERQYERAAQRSLQEAADQGPPYDAEEISQLERQLEQEIEQQLDQQDNFYRYEYDYEYGDSELAQEQDDSRLLERGDYDVYQEERYAEGDNEGFFGFFDDDDEFAGYDYIEDESEYVDPYNAEFGEDRFYTDSWYEEGSIYDSSYE